MLKTRNSGVDASMVKHTELKGVSFSIVIWPKEQSSDEIHKHFQNILIY